MTNLGDNGTAPYTAVQLNPGLSNAGDQPLPVAFINSLNTGIGHPSAAAFTLIANGVELGRVQGLVFSCPAYFGESIATGLSANTGSATGATLLAASYNFVSATGTNGGVKLPAISTITTGTVFQSVSLAVFNNCGSTIRVIASGSDTVDGITGDPGVALSSGNRCNYIAIKAGVWISAQFGAVSS